MRILSKIIFALTLIAFIQPLNAQSTSSFGIKAGYINSGFIGEDASDQDKKPGFQAGAFFNVTSGNGIIGFQPEILYSQKSTTFRALNIQEEYRLSYLKVPALLKISIPLDMIRPNIFVGPYASFRLSEDYTYTDLITGVTASDSDQTQSIDYGAVFGGGVDVQLSSILLTADLRYDLGMQELEDAEQPKDIKNGDFSFNVGIAFPL